MTKLLGIIWRAVWLPPMLTTFFLLALIVLIRNGRRDATYILELL